VSEGEKRRATPLESKKKKTKRGSGVGGGHELATLEKKPRQKKEVSAVKARSAGEGATTKKISENIFCTPGQRKKGNEKTQLSTHKENA